MNPADNGPSVARRRILCISLSLISRDARVLRQISLLSKFGDVTTVGFGERPAGATHHLRVPDGLKTLPQTIFGVLKLAIRAHEAAECSSPAARFVLNHMKPDTYDLVVANEARSLDLAFQLAHSAPVWADMHEWSPEERTHIRSWKLLVAPFMVHLCAKYLPRATLITTVSRGIIDLYREHFQVESLLMANAGAFQNISVQEVTSDGIACVHSGAAISGRGLEHMVAAFTELPERFTLDLYLVPGGDGGQHLRQLQRIANGSKRIRFLDPVSPVELPGVLSKYDLGLIWVPPTHTNARLTLPNKFFDYVQARIGVSIGPSPEMVREVEELGIGVVSDAFDAESFKTSILDLDRSALMAFKQNADRAARQMSFEALTKPVVARLASILESRGKQVGV